VRVELLHPVQDRSSSIRAVTVVDDGKHLLRWCDVEPLETPVRRRRFRRSSVSVSCSVRLLDKQLVGGATRLWLRQQAADGAAQLKQQATASYYRAVDPTPLSGPPPLRGGRGDRQLPRHRRGRRDLLRRE
jgi:hypothetical protein